MLHHREKGAAPWRGAATQRMGPAPSNGAIWWSTQRALSTGTPKKKMGAPKEDNVKKYSTSPNPSPDPKEGLGGTLNPPSLWIATHHYQEATVEDLEASQLVDSDSTHSRATVEGLYRRGHR